MNIIKIILLITNDLCVFLISNSRYYLCIVNVQKRFYINVNNIKRNYLAAYAKLYQLYRIKIRKTNLY